MRDADCSLEFQRCISRRCRLARPDVESISEHFEHGAALRSPEQLDVVPADLRLLNARLAAVAVPQFPHLQQQLKLLANFFEDIADGVFQAGTDVLRKGAACPSLHGQETDIITDSLPEIEYADDSPVVRTVLGRHQMFSATTAVFEKIVGRKISFAP